MLQVNKQFHFRIVMFGVKTMFGSAFSPICFEGGVSCFIDVICINLRILVSNTISIDSVRVV